MLKSPTILLKQIEKAIFPNDLHLKIVLTRCHNDCAKVRMHDFGIIGMELPQYEKDRCVSCKACINYCNKKSVGTLRLTLLGRTGKKNPRLGEDFIKWVNAKSIIKIILNIYDYVDYYMDPNPPDGKEDIYWNRIRYK